jgi:hypothetical protein
MYRCFKAFLRVLRQRSLEVEQPIRNRQVMGSTPIVGLFFSPLVEELQYVDGDRDIVRASKAQGQFEASYKSREGLATEQRQLGAYIRGSNASEMRPYRLQEPVRFRGLARKDYTRDQTSPRLRRAGCTCSFSARPQRVASEMRPYLFAQNCLE